MMIELLKAQWEEHRRAVEKSLTADGLATLEAITRQMLSALKAGRKILFCGNGGSAADSQHIAAELIGRFMRERRSLPAIALTTDTSILTAVANDYSYADIFARQVEGLGQKGDVLVAISTSGNSKNVLEAAKKAKAEELVVIGFTGADGGALKNLADICFCAQTKKTQHIQEVHITAFHSICEVIESVLFGA